MQRPLREGAELVDHLGTFLAVGDRTVFVPAGTQRRLIGLENLNLERIGHTMAESPEPVIWIVSGTVTEYRGMNYLLVRRAMVKNRPPAADLPPPAMGSGKP
jgi:hypothetical protein